MFRVLIVEADLRKGSPRAIDYFRIFCYRFENGFDRKVYLKEREMRS